MNIVHTLYISYFKITLCRREQAFNEEYLPENFPYRLAVALGHEFNVSSKNLHFPFSANHSHFPGLLQGD